MLFSKRQLLEKMTLTWHEHFATSIDKAGMVPQMMAVQEELLRRNALGDFRRMLIEISKDPAMLIWLDNNQNNGRGTKPPSENYARELMQLFSLGTVELDMDGSIKRDALGKPIPAYTERDVKELARALTGWVVYYDDQAKQYLSYHFNFHSARPTGWLGRALDGATAKEVPPGLDFGGGGLLLAGAKNRPISLGTLTDFQLLAGDIALAAYRDLMDYERPDSAIAEFNSTQRKTAIDSGNFLRERTKNYKPAVAYPNNNRLADSLRDVASVIWANLGARGFSVALGGFDTHKGQNENNLHAFLLKTFSDAVTAFYNDLRAQNLSRNVIIATLSDFGRRPEENSDLGTDHGYANCCFVIGDKVKPGMYGRYPSLESSKLVFDRNLDITVDYRAVLATILAKHMDVDPKPVVGVNEVMGFL
jgi:hypothetical protein